MRIAFDLDETLGVPITDGRTVVGFQFRVGCLGLLQRLSREHHLILWTVSSHIYVDKALGFGLRPFFREVYCWDDLPGSWKDVRRVRADYLIDDSEHHMDAARTYGLEERYIVVPAYGSPEDVADSALWVRLIDTRLGGNATRNETP